MWYSLQKTRDLYRNFYLNLIFREYIGVCVAFSVLLLILSSNSKQLLKDIYKIS